ncbi:MAG TPA: hypothetical protein VFD13_03130, partial [Candidatus Kapabacteria bacterium]|nr:hypothetical protein [Candidatus Kapabacteria bacterium]
MRWNSRKWLASATMLAVMLLFAAADGARGQWKIVAPKALASIFSSDGVICYRDGIIWAGGGNLVFSKDSGTSWNSGNYSGATVGMKFFNRDIGVLSAGGRELFLTKDGGLDWTPATTIAGTSSTIDVGFGTSANILYGVEEEMGLAISTDAGLSWQLTPIAGLVLAIAQNKSGMIYVTAGPFSDPGILLGQLYSSSDAGQSWKSAAGLFDEDCFSMTIDSCDPARFYIANENNAWTGDGYSHIYVSSNTGQTWNADFTLPSPYLIGSIANSSHAIYAGTLSDGIIRSTDRGVTWKSIGGPGCGPDSRNVCVINDNIIFAFDSIALPQGSGDSALVTPSRPVTLTQSSCTSADTSVPIAIDGCGASTGSLDSLWLTGSAAFQIADPRAAPRAMATIDSILVSYTGSRGPDTAILHLRYDLGSGARDTTIQLIGTITSPLLAQPAQLHREAASAYFGQIDSLPLAVDMSSRINLDSIWPYLDNIQATYSWDSSVVSYGGYVPPSGWTLMSFSSHANTVDFEVQNHTPTVSNPMDLGMALFYPISTQLASSWVELPRFVVDVGGQALSICVSENEDSHWAVKTLGAPSGVAGAPPSKRNQFSLYPNPSDGNVWITSSNTIGRVTIA